jgi:hypothetical protein
MTFDMTRDSAGAITAATAVFYFQVARLPGGTTPVAAHIHTGPGGVNGPIIVDTGLTAATGFTLTNGIGEFTSNRITVLPATLQGIISNPAGFYFNVHSLANPGGVVRGQLVRTQ